MKKFVLIALALVMALSLLTACGDKTDTGSTGGNNSTPGTSQGGNDNDKDYWFDNVFTQQVPKPQYGFKKETSIDSHTFTAYPDWTREQAKSYVTELEAAGFAIWGSVIDDDDKYMAYLENADGSYTVTVNQDSDSTVARSNSLVISNSTATN
jgi:hypothetical protein